MPAEVRLRVEGLQEFQRQVSRAVDRDIPKRIGQVHRDVGQLVISKLRPRPVPEAVGAGRGAAVRPSAARREVTLRVGGAHREKPPLTQWGKRRLRLFRPAPERPNILGTAVEHRDTIMAMLEDGYIRALKPPFD